MTNKRISQCSSRCFGKVRLMAIYRSLIQVIQYRALDVLDDLYHYCIIFAYAITSSILSISPDGNIAAIATGDGHDLTRRSTSHWSKRNIAQMLQAFSFIGRKLLHSSAVGCQRSRTSTTLIRSTSAEDFCQRAAWEAAAERTAGHILQQTFLER